MSKSQRQVVFHLVKAIVDEVLFLKLVLLCSFTTCLGRCEKTLRFDVRILQFHYLPRSPGEAPKFEIVVEQFARCNNNHTKSYTLICRVTTTSYFPELVFDKLKMLGTTHPYLNKYSEGVYM